MDLQALLPLVLACAPQVDAGTVVAIVRTESGGNPHAIGIVGGRLERQPRHRAEAVATLDSLEAGGWDYSVGLAQINRRNFTRLGLTREAALEPCRNLGAMQAVLTECFVRAGEQPVQTALRRALSCYYSGNFETGFVHGYVDRVIRNVPTTPFPSGVPP